MPGILFWARRIKSWVHSSIGAIRLQQLRFIHTYDSVQAITEIRYINHYWTSPCKVDQISSVNAPTLRVKQVFYVTTILSLFPAKMCQSHPFTVRLHWVNEQILVPAFCWLARLKWYELFLSYSTTNYLANSSCNSWRPINHRYEWTLMVDCSARRQNVIDEKSGSLLNRQK